MKSYMIALCALACLACEPVDDMIIDADAGVEEAAPDASAVDTGTDTVEEEDVADTIDKQFGGGYPIYKPSPSDYTLLPYSIQVGVTLPPGYNASNGLWLYSLWSRNGVVGGGGRLGNWYRGSSGPNGGVVMVVPPRPFYSGSWTCTPTFFAAECVHYDGRRVSVICPYAVVGEIKTWRSSYNVYAPEVGYFYWDSAVGSETQLRLQSFAWRHVLPMRSVTITGSGKQVNCAYPWPQTVDVWVERR